MQINVVTHNIIFNQYFLLQLSVLTINDTFKVHSPVDK